MKLDMCAEVEVDSQRLAELFWHMDSGQQAEFFGHLYDIIRRDNEAGKTWFANSEYCDMQWFSLRDSVRKIENPRRRLKVANMIRAVAGQFFLYTIGNEWDWERSEWSVEP